MKKMKPIDEAYEFALTGLGAAAGVWLKMRAIPKNKPIPDKLMREYSNYASFACRYWNKYRELGEKEFLKTFKPFESKFNGKMKTAKFPFSK